jgi:hypothetical protein
MDHRPCVIAASTVLLSINRTLTKEQLMLIMLSVIPTWGSIESVSSFVGIYIFICRTRGEERFELVTSVSLSVIPTN